MLSATQTAISQADLLRLKTLLDAGQEVVWYNCATWKRTRAKVLEMDRNECQVCKGRGKYRRGEIVHHVKHLRDRPDLALSVFDPDTGERQLLTVCKRCHEELHPEAQRQYRTEREPVISERWD